MTVLSFTLALVLSSSPADAGLVYTNSVVVRSTYATGNMLSTREAPGSAYFYCGSSSSGSSPLGFCYASDGEGNTMGCVTSDPEMVSVIHGMDAYSAVTAYYSGGACTTLVATKGSPSLP